MDPPFPAGLFGVENLGPGAYLNGGILPLVGGELARAAFEHGLEEYGVAILKKYSDMVAPMGETYLWYFPDGRPGREAESMSPEVIPTDGWGSSAMLWARMEGLAEIRDWGKLFGDLRLSPRWVAAGIEKARVEVEYPAGGSQVAYSFIWERRRKRINLEGENPGPCELRLLLPPGERPKKTVLEGARGPFMEERV